MVKRKSKSNVVEQSKHKARIEISLSDENQSCNEDTKKKEEKTEQKKKERNIDNK